MRTCAIIGAGNLGRPVAERLIAQGFAVTVCDSDPERLEPLAALGARTTENADDCVGCGILLALVRTEAQLRAVADALKPHAAAGDILLVMSTVPAEAVREIAASGLRVLDAPVSGGAARAREGRLTVMAGGDEADLEAARPVLSALADNIFHCGGIGTGQMTKIVNNILCHAASTLMGEALRLGLAHGLRPEAMAEVMEVSTGRNWLSAGPDLAREVLGDQSVDRETFDGILAILQKDMDLAAALARDESPDFPMIAGVARLIAGLGDETYQTWRKVSGQTGD